MNASRVVETVSDLLLVYVWAPMAGLVVGMAFGGWAGLAADAAVAAILFGVARAAAAIVRKSRETRVPQRSFPARRD